MAPSTPTPKPQTPEPPPPPPPMDSSTSDRPEIAFFDVETTVPTRPGQRHALLEFGSILVCPQKLVELHSYSTLVQPSDLSLISSLSERCNGISRTAVASAPTFRDVADTVFDILHGRIWAGHNILRFDCARIREAFADIGRPAPEPRGMIDSLVLLKQRFGARAGNMKMASLATYFGLGEQSHRSLADVRMNLEVLKYCATVLFLESSLPDIFTANSWVLPNATTRSRSNTRASPSSSLNFENQRDPFDMGILTNPMTTELLQPDVPMEEPTVPVAPELPSESASPNSTGSDQMGFLDPNEISITSISASLIPLYRGIQRIQILHQGASFKLGCTRLRVRFRLSTKFVDQAGRPRLSFVVDSPPNLCRVLDECDQHAQRLSVDSGSDSEWRSVVTRKSGFEDWPTVRLHIPTIVNGDTAKYATEIYLKEASGITQKLVFSRFDAAELGTLFTLGTSLDAYFSLEPYNYQLNAGIRLVAEKLMIYSR